MKKGAIFLLIFLLLSGCWDKTEVNELAIVLAIGIDVNEKGLYNVSLQIAKPVAFGKGEGGKPGEKPFLTVTTQGKTVSQAMVKYYNTSPRKIYWGHNKLIIFGDKISKKGLKEALDWVERVESLRFSTYIFSTPKTAQEILNGTFELEKIPSLAIQSTIRHRHQYLAKITPTLNKFIEGMLSHNNISYATNLAMVNNDLEIQGINIYKDGRFIYNLNNEQTLDLMRIYNRVKGGVILIPCKKNSKKYTSFEVIRCKTTLSPEVDNKQVKFHINISMEGIIDSTQCGEKITDEKKIKLLEKDINKIIEKRVHSIITLAQKDIKTDILYFDEILKKKKPGQWAGLENDWEKIFPQVESDIVVESHIRRFSWVKDPIPIKKK